mgnify:CR=1 FL=1
MCIRDRLSLVGFTALGTWGTLSVFVLFQVLRRAGEYAFGRPAREVLFTVVPPEDRYKAKNFIDTFVYRGGDQIGAWSYAGLSAAGLAAGTISLMAAPMSFLWLGMAYWLGRRNVRMEKG